MTTIRSLLLNFISISYSIFIQKIKKQTRKLVAGGSKHCFEIVDRTDKPYNIPAYIHTTRRYYPSLKRFSKSIHFCLLLIIPYSHKKTNILILKNAHFS
ncbi:hypothetical protein AZJ39_02265 [Streptococcus pneumoniae]|uniref:Uncharacterized protein n=1 Tax=Streptococcus pneumoniae TaxID=1313 RepID=A0A5C8R3F8_STREE|nr:hypothetical protein AZK38_01880 [Streptococcus pneumoniae]TVV57958.1 hypothetical protein AZK37_06000 [Streptococcus pneumoniae]TVV90042.1 hypothetical protein AZK22_01775 [Streptococcus pneumoniae]TVW01611.1 hypothetical protein AZK15_02395 [Streptococcus pneumoniae]TVW27210.1 hypothetical protein AZK02_05315 [Streptococcus pneumoniae]